MKKTFKIFIWIILVVVASNRIFNSFVVKSDIYLEYKYGMNYNTIRLQKGIPLLSKDFTLTDDEYYSNLLVWKNKSNLNRDKYLHLDKKMTIRNKNLLLEEDTFKYIYNPNDSLTYSLISSMYYYSTPDREKKHIWLERKVIKGEIISSDTISRGIIIPHGDVIKKIID